jgi:site-specific DNA-adenine methylase
MGRRNLLEYFKSPMNYTGNKYKLLPQIEPLFPKDIDKFIDLFCGGLDVSLNVKANKKYCNDIEPHIIDFYIHILYSNGEEVNTRLLDIVKQYNLSKENSEGYNQLREEYNERSNWIFIL